MAITKIDVINGDVLCTGETDVEFTQTPVDSSYDDMITAFSDTEQLLTINISEPIKRIMKFYNIKAGVPESFVELPYDDMSGGDQAVLDAFIIAATT